MFLIHMRIRRSAHIRTNGNGIDLGPPKPVPGSQLNWDYCRTDQFEPKNYQKKEKKRTGLSYKRSRPSNNLNPCESTTHFIYLINTSKSLQPICNFSHIFSFCCPHSTSRYFTLLHLTRCVLCRCLRAASSRWSIFGFSFQIEGIGNENGFLLSFSSQCGFGDGVKCLFDIRCFFC